MPFPAIADPVPATVITAAWEIANPLAAVRWIRQLMGNADPPAGALALISTSPTAGGWAKIPADVLAPGAVVSHLTYTPVNKAGDTMTGNLTAPGFQAGSQGVNGGAGGVNGAAGGVNGGTGGYSGGSTTVGVPSMLGAIVGAQGVGVIGVGGINVTGGGPIQGGSTTAGADLLVMGVQVGARGYQGGSTTAGVPNMLGAVVGAQGVAVLGIGGVAVSLGGSVAVSGGGGVAVSGAGGVSAGTGGYSGGSTTAGVPSVLGLSVGSQGVGVNGLGGVNVSGGGPIQGGSKTIGADLLVMGLQVGSHGILSDAAISAPSLAATGPSGVAVSGGGGVAVSGGGGYSGGSTTVGVPSVLGLVVGAQGIAPSGPVASSRPTGSPFTAVSTTVCTGVNADMTDGFHASGTPGTPGVLPVTDGSGKLDPAWLPSIAIAGVPSNLIAAVAIAAQIPAGWTRYSTLDGLMPVGAGSSFGVGFTENTSYGSSWSHGHADGGVHLHSGAPLGVSGVTGGPSASAPANQVSPGTDFAVGNHTHDQGSLDVSGNTANNSAVATSSDRWIIPSRALVYVIKS